MPGKNIGPGTLDVSTRQTIENGRTSGFDRAGFRPRVRITRQLAEFQNFVQTISLAEGPRNWSEF